MLKKIKFIILLLSVSTLSFAQRGKGDGTVTDEQIVVEKSKKPQIVTPSRIFEKIPSTVTADDKKKIVYEFVERKLPVQTPKLTPPVTQMPENTNDKAAKEMVYDNIIQVGVGSYGRKFIEAHLSSKTDKNIIFGGSLKHNSNDRGPVDGGNSATSINKVNGFARYFGEKIKVEGGLNYQRNAVRYYGYRQPAGITFDTDSIKQTINDIGGKIGLENSDPDGKLDWGINTRLNYLFTQNKMSELVWKSDARMAFPITDNFTALVNADAIVTQVTDSLTNYRRFFRVTPMFSYNFNRSITLTLGLNALHERDRDKLLATSKFFPVANVDVVVGNGLHIFGGLHGDMENNTLSTLLYENLFLGRKQALFNTTKEMEFYAGAKGKIAEQFTFDLKGSYATYRNFHVFNNSGIDSTRFVTQYDTAKTKVFSFTGLLTFVLSNQFNSSLKANYYNYKMGSFAEAWHRPTFTASWSNTLIFKDKLILNADFYTMMGIKGKNLMSDRTVSLPAIFDLNLKFSYLFSERITGFVNLNNLIGKEYQRLLNYPSQGFNFLVGAAYSFNWAKQN
jgi:hypothetical protein